MNNTNKIALKWIAVTLCCAILAFLIPFLTGSFFAEERGDIIILLDPGHGGADSGAVNYSDGLYEADLNLAIARACRDELLKYDGVQVYMTHEGISHDTTLSLDARVAMAKDLNADILISLHCNDADNKEANGAEIYVSHSTRELRYNQESTSLAVRILSQFKLLDINVRGVKTRLSGGDRVYRYNDGSTEIGDYYAVIGETIGKYDIPGILVEHGFVSGDAEHLDTIEELTRLGVADALGIADYYGLKPKSGDAENIEKPEEIVIVTEQDLLSASDAEAQIIALPESFNENNAERLENARKAYELLTPEGKTLVEKELVNQLYHSVLMYDYQTHPIRIEAVEESGFTVNRITHIISGVNMASADLSGTNASGLKSALTVYYDTNFLQEGFVVSSSDIVILAPDGTPSDIAAQLGTGCMIQLLVNGDVVDELSVVIPGELSGDGVCDSLDRYLLEGHIYSGAELTKAQLIAADVNGDGIVDYLDAEELSLLISGANQ